MAQPDFQLYPTFDLANSNQVMSYYYRNGRIYVTNGDFRDELKEVVTSNSTGQRRATRIIDPNGPGTTYTTSLGNTITVGAGEQLWLNHNYTGNSNFNSRTIASINDSWWYDVDQHREFRVWLVLGRDNTAVLDGTTYYNWKVTNAVIEYNEVEANASSGTFRFSTVPQDPVTVEGTLHIESSNATWPTFSAILYKGTPSNLPGSVLATETINRSSAVDEDVTVSIELDPVQISVNDTITLAAQVDGTSGQIATIASPLRVTSYELSVTGDEGEYTAGQPVVIGGLGTSLDVSDDCDPLLNNVGGYRANERVQIIEYSESEIGSGSLTPFNLDDIRSGSAPKSSVPESYYTSLAFNRNRYAGSKFTRSEVNSNTIPQNYQYFLRRDSIDNGDEGTDGISSPDVLGSISAVTLQDTFLGYFSRIIDPYPTLNGKTAYFVKYLMNDQNNVQDPSLSELGRINFIETFKIRDINGEITRVQPVIQNRENAEELGDLELNTNIFKIGEFPYPVLYSQNSATSFTQNLPLSGSTAFFTSGEIDIDTYQNYAFNTTDTTPTNQFPIQSILRNPINVPRTRLIPSAINGTGVNNIATSIFNQNNNAIEFPNSPLTDQYTVEGTFTFYTSPLPRRVSRNISNVGEYAGISTFTVLRNGRAFTPSNARLNITGQRNVTQSGTPTNYAHPQNPMSLTTSTTRRSPNGVNAQNPFQRLNNELRMRLHTDVHNHGLSLNGYPHVGGTNPNEGDRIKWELSFTIPSSMVTPGDTFNFEFRNERSTRVGNIDKDDHAGEDSPSWQRSIFPPVPVGNPDQPSFSLSVRGTQTQNIQEDDLNSVNFPYWDKPPGTTNQIRLVSNQLNDFYGGDYYQGNVNYIPGVNADFPLAQEPDFLQFSPVRNRWEIEVGDEFRFENDEEKVFTVAGINNSGEQLIITLDREVSTSINLDFFLIRRYENAPNIIILDQQKPYNVPPSASSSPGILLPEFRIESLSSNPDAIVTNLIERNLI